MDLQDGQILNESRRIATLGMFIIDTLRYEDTITGEDLGDRGFGEQIGGGGTYFALGARMWLHPCRIMMTIDRGTDFPSSAQRLLDQFSQSDNACTHSHCLWRYRDRHGKTTKAVNVYRGDKREFNYLTPKLRLDPMDLLDDKLTVFPRFLHCICSPERAMSICNQVNDLKDRWPNNCRPYIIWEPIPDSAVPENLEAALQVCQLVDVLSPNHEESASFLTEIMVNTDQEKSLFIERMAREWHSRIRQKGTHVPLICLRSGSLGTLVLSNSPSTDTQIPHMSWTAAYHSNLEAHKIVDVTGAGNAWLGGFTAGLSVAVDHHGLDIRSPWTLKDIITAAQMGSVSASFMIEQQSLPRMDLSDRQTFWNGETACSRLAKLQSHDTVKAVT